MVFDLAMAQNAIIKNLRIDIDHGRGRKYPVYLFYDSIGTFPIKHPQQLAPLCVQHIPSQ